MTKSATSVAALLFASLLASPSMAQTTPPPSGAIKLSAAQCSALWNKLDASKSGSVTQAAASSYVADFKAVDTNNDGKLSQAEFTAGCNKGLVHDTASSGAGSGVPSKK
jgi:EF hand domain-containing protein